ncbi:D-alanyl-D-alanine carboxypeptidase family protein [Egicoccus halophilus]|uniref:Peptidase S11 D-alanyl-D-alanine carboxypeptidase A N-terminal domain-containing protein n=1 Tax=Egicoccus halophilus TaxID=1670830 RepID=A0A8J3A972_9ACTN|nr:serine hydrolase [Egicoccus halophilus]GGI04877.1 hypothetical protein GCM10011354_11290 [Egicoccus halophilus]
MTAKIARRRRATTVLAALTASLCLVGPVPATAELTAPPTPAVAGPPPSDWPDVPEDVTASAVVLVEASSGQRLLERGAEQPRPVASTIKVLTALTAVDRVELDAEVTVGPEVLVEGASVGLRPGETWTVRQLLEAILIRSGNDAAEALATFVGGDTDRFLRLMEQDAARLGLEQRDFGSVTGLGDLHEVSALDLATIARAALAHEQLRPLLARREVTLPGQPTEPNRNLLLGSYPGATGVKTGFTLAAGNSLIASAQRDGRELVAVVLDAGDDPARFTQAARLLDAGFDAYALEQPSVRLDLAVAGGWHSYALPPTTVTTPTDRPASVSVTVPARPPEAQVEVEVHAGAEPLTELAARTLASPSAVAAEAGDGDAGSGTPDAGSAARLGAALVDGAYASLRAASGADALR